MQATTRATRARASNSARCLRTVPLANAVGAACIRSQSYRNTVRAPATPESRAFSLEGSEMKSAEQMMEEVLDRVRKTTAEECPFCADAPGGYDFVRCAQALQDLPKGTS